MVPASVAARNAVPLPRPMHLLAPNMFASQRRKPRNDQARFLKLGEQIVASLMKAADDQVTEANNLLASVKALAEGINAQMAEHARMLDDMDARMHAFGSSVVEAHKKFLNGHGKTP